VLYEPEKVFAEIKEIPKGAWVLPMVALVLLSIVGMYAVIHMIGPDTYFRLQIEASPRAAQMTPEQIEQAAGSGFVSGLTYTMGVAAPPLLLLIVAGVLFGLTQMMDGATTYGKVLAVCGYSNFVYFLVMTLMSVLIVAVSADRSTLDVQALVKMNPTIFMDKATTSKALYSLAGSLDLLSVWLMFLLALGLTKVSRLKMSKAWTVVLIPWVLYVLVKAGLAAIF
jgi:hypothetical protein